MTIVKCLGKILFMSDRANISQTKITLKEFSKNFFIKGICPINNRKIKRNKGYSASYLYNSRLLLDKHIYPVIGHLYIQDIEPKDIDDFAVLMLVDKNYSGTSVNGALSCLRIVFKEAQRNNLVTYNPAKKVKFVNSQSKTKGLLSTFEANLLMKKEYWYNEIFWMFNRTGRYTGMRLGEIAALSVNDIKFEDNLHYISVTKNYDFIEGLKHETKTKVNRIVPIPAWLAEDLKNFNPDYKYMFSPDGNKPYKKSILCLRFRQALNNIGLSEKERVQRNITFHSWRHRYISLLNGTIPHEQLRLIVGHSQEATTDLYTHLIVSKAKRILSKPFFEDIYRDCSRIY